MLVLPAAANCLFMSHLLNAVGDATESVSDFLFGRTHTYDRSCITLVRFNQACI